MQRIVSNHGKFWIRVLHPKVFLLQHYFVADPPLDPIQITLVNSGYWFQNIKCQKLWRPAVANMSYNIAFVIWRINILVSGESSLRWGLPNVV